MGLALSIQTHGNWVHIISPNLDRLDYCHFMTLVNRLKEDFKHRLNTGHYPNQPVYEYESTKEELIEAIKEFDSDIQVN